MSSHHIVRENQEPALLIQHFDAVDMESLGQILEWSPTLIASDVDYERIVSEDIKVDILFSNNNRELEQEGTKLFAIHESYEEAALQYLVKHNYKAVNVLCDQIDELFYQYADDINIVLFITSRRYVFVKKRFEKWKPKGEYLYVQDESLKSFQGLSFVENGKFQVEHDGFVSIEFNTDEFVLLGEDI